MTLSRKAQNALREIRNGNHRWVTTRAIEAVYGEDIATELHDSFVPIEEGSDRLVLREE